MTALKFQTGETSDIPSLLRTERESLREQDRKEERICVLIVFGERERESSLYCPVKSASDNM